MPRESSGEAKRIADGIDFWPTCRLVESPRIIGCRSGALICTMARSWTCRCRDGGLIFLAVVERDFDLPRIGDDVIVSEDVSCFIDDEPEPWLPAGPGRRRSRSHDARGDLTRIRCFCGKPPMLFCSSASSASLPAAS